MVEREVGEKHLREYVDLEVPCATLGADPTRSEQVFWNLPKNAVKFTPKGREVVVRTSCERDAAMPERGAVWW